MRPAAWDAAAHASALLGRIVDNETSTARQKADAAAFVELELDEALLLAAAVFFLGAWLVIMSFHLIAILNG